MNKKDCCEDFKPNADKIDAFILLQHARSGGTHAYTGKPFVFCPWCGAALSDSTSTGEI